MGLLANASSSIPTIREIAKEGGVSPGRLMTSYANARSAWLHVFSLAHEPEQRRALQSAVRNWHPELARALDERARPAATSPREGLSPLSRALVLIAAGIVAVADARGAAAGISAPLVGGVAGLLAGVAGTQAIRTSQRRTALIVVVLIALGVTIGLVIEGVANSTPPRTPKRQPPAIGSWPTSTPPRRCPPCAKKPVTASGARRRSTSATSSSSPPATSTSRRGIHAMVMTTTMHPHHPGVREFQARS